MTFAGCEMKSDSSNWSVSLVEASTPGLNTSSGSMEMDASGVSDTLVVCQILVTLPPTTLPVRRK